MDGAPLLNGRDTPARLKRGAGLLILVFWAVHYLMLSARAGILLHWGTPGFEDQLEIALRRFMVALFGSALCYLVYRALRPLRQRPFGWQTAIGAALAFVAAGLYTVAHTLTFYEFTPERATEVLGTVSHFLYTAMYWFWFYFSWTTAYLALSYSVTVQAQERHAADLAVRAQEAQVRALRYQINPHFLFNTLNAIAALIRDAPGQAEEMVVQLSDFFRRSLAVNPMEDVTLRQEVDLQRLYMEIERTRFPDRLRFEVAMDEGSAEAPVPALLLQPLVENAVKHGVARWEGTTRVRIRARLDGPVLEIVVENDALAAGIAADGEKVGLRNVAERLRSRFGDRATLTAADLAEGGFRNTLRIPLGR